MGILGSIGRTFLGSKVASKTRGAGIAGAALGFFATRIATRSLPGAALVGGGLLAKHLWDRKREREARAETQPITEAEPAVTPRADVVEADRP